MSPGGSAAAAPSGAGLDVFLDHFESAREFGLSFASIAAASAILLSNHAGSKSRLCRVALPAALDFRWASFSSQASKTFSATTRW
jgi:hypothetical protein